jgi:hypothetical protein
MRTAGVISILALGTGSAFGQDAVSRDQQIAELKDKVAALSAQIDALQSPAGASLETRLDGAVRNSPAEALREPRRLNISAPGAEGINLGGLIHVRGDYWGNYHSSVGKDDVNSIGTEAQLAFDARVSEKTSVGITLHYSDVWGGNTENGIGSVSGIAADASIDEGEHIDAQRAVLMVRDIYNTSVDLTAGRQAIEFGKERVLGDDDWRLRRTTFDGFRFDNDLGDGGGKWSIVALRLNDNDNTFVDDLGPAGGVSTVNNADLYGAYYTTTMNGVGGVDLYVFHLEDMNYSDSGAVGRTRFTTYGARWASEDMGGLCFDAEGVTQFGELMGNRTHNFGFGTYALHVGACFKPGNIEFFDGFCVGYDYATGGNDLSENYQQISPSLHGWFGLTDFFSWTNIQHWMVGTNFKMGDGCVCVGYHWNRRASDDAGFVGYNYSDATTGGNRSLGQEADVTYIVECSKSTSVGMGVGYFFAGNGFHDMTGVSGDMVYGYFAATTRF